MKQANNNGIPHAIHKIDVAITRPFALGVSAAPASWGGAGSPRIAIAGRSVSMVESGAQEAIWTRVEQAGPGVVRMHSNAPEGVGEGWLDRLFRPHEPELEWTDPVIARLAAAYPGLRSLTDGSLYLGLVTSITGQSISIASAMAAQRRLASLFSDGITVEANHLVPLPDANTLAHASVERIRTSGVTWKRAEALKEIAREAASGTLPTPGSMPDDDLMRGLRELPLVGPWTAASALLWGIGAPDAFPEGDVALLRAARLAYDDAGMSMEDLARIADGWRPHRGVASRLLWTNLLGPAWSVNDEDQDDPTNEQGSTSDTGIAS